MEVFTEERLWLVGVAMAMILLDIVSGVVKACMNRELSSSVMREGLYHKSVYFLIIAMSILLEVGASHVDLGFDPPTVLFVCGYVIMMEALSLWENVCAVNPELNNSKLAQYFDKGNHSK